MFISTKYADKSRENGKKTQLWAPYVIINFNSFR